MSITTHLDFWIKKKSLLLATKNFDKENKLCRVNVLRIYFHLDIKCNDLSTSLNIFFRHDIKMKIS
jgi:hypothetical protein